MFRAKTSFDRQFLRLVLPKMRAQLEIGALYVRHDLECFTEATSRAWRVGCRLGATHLSSECYHELSDWVDCQLLELIDQPDPPGLVTPVKLAQITGEPRGVDSVLDRAE